MRGGSGEAPRRLQGGSGEPTGKRVGLLYEVLCGGFAFVGFMRAMKGDAPQGKIVA